MLFIRHNQQHRQRRQRESLCPRLETWVHQSSFELEAHTQGGPSRLLRVPTRLRALNFAQFGARMGSDWGDNPYHTQNNDHRHSAIS
jgi:hypothetical protein